MYSSSNSRVVLLICISFTFITSLYTTFVFARFIFRHTSLIAAFNSFMGCCCSSGLLGIRTISSEKFFCSSEYITQCYCEGLEEYSFSLTYSSSKSGVSSQISIVSLTNEGYPLWFVTPKASVFS